MFISVKPTGFKSFPSLWSGYRERLRRTLCTPDWPTPWSALPGLVHLFNAIMLHAFDILIILVPGYVFPFKAHFYAIPTSIECKKKLV